MDKDKKYKINGYKRFIVIKKSEEEIILKLIENDKLYRLPANENIDFNVGDIVLLFLYKNTIYLFKDNNDTQIKIKFDG